MLVKNISEIAHTSQGVKNLKAFMVANSAAKHRSCLSSCFKSSA